jgi:hypothetical protein
MPRVRTVITAALLAAQVAQPAGAYTPAVGSNVRLNQDASGNPHNEPFVAISPTSASNIVAGGNDYRSGDGESGFYTSTDGGSTWTDGILPMGSDAVGPISSAGDPTIAFANDGTTVLYGQLAFQFGAFSPTGAGGCDPTSGVYVSRSTNKGIVWAAGGKIAGNGATVFNDKPMLTVDRSSGNAYIAYTRFTYATALTCTTGTNPASSPIMLRRSADKGATWSGEVDASGPSYTDSHGAIPAAGPSGELYVAFEGAGPGCGDCIVVAKSTTQGATISQRTKVANITGLTSLSAGPGLTFRANSFPSMAVDPQGRVYVVWAEERDADADVWLSRSVNGGSSWSAPERVNQDPAGDQFFPWIAADAAGTVWVGWYDRREDPLNRLYKPYVAHSHDQGGSWTEVAAAPEASDPGSVVYPSGNAFIGDYSGLAALPAGGAFAAWVDTREGGDQNIYGAALSLDPVSRLAGSDRVATAIAISKDAFPAASAGAVVLSRSDLFADALAGTPLAVAKGGPLLLTASTSLDGRTRSEIQRVLPSGETVYLLGGTGALSSSVEAEIVAAGYQAVRYAGNDRYGTAVAIADQGLSNPATLLLATGTNFPDALSGGAAAAKVSGAILLTAGSAMPPATADYLSAHPSATRWALGGPAAAADPGATAIVGADRYETSRKVAETFFSTLDTVGVASGTNFPDALSGGAHVGKKGGPMLLTSPSSLSATIRGYLEANAAAIGAAFVYGGAAAVSNAVLSAVRAAITA